MTHAVLNLAFVFLARHWLSAIVNAAVTAGLGIGLLRWTRKWPGLTISSLQLVRLRRLVFLTALCKGALSLIIGISRPGSVRLPFMCGVQMPDPFELLGLFDTRNSFWYPTSATKAVTLMLLGAASCFLLGRAVQIVRSIHLFRTLVSLGSVPPPAVAAALKRAATDLALPAVGRLPTLILINVSYPTPLLVGIPYPYLLLAPQLILILTEEELEMALRHELAHFRRRDHWWRWLFTWIGDIGQSNPVSARLTMLAVEEEEELCDRLSVHTAQEALLLAKAIRKSVALYQGQTQRGPGKV